MTIKLNRVSPSLSIFFGLVFVWNCPAGFSAEPQLKLISVQKIWDQAPTNAFTDLVRFQDRFYCVFREAAAHVSPDGKIRVLSSPDGSTWQSEALIEKPGFDLRDPKIVVHPDQKRLMINGGAAVRDGNKPSTEEHSFVSFSEDGKTWSQPEWVAGLNQWMWRVTWFQGKAYGMAYFSGPSSRSERNYGIILYAGEDGKTYTPLVPSFSVESGPTEATLRFAEDGTGYCLQRRDGKASNTALLGTSKPPYTEWQWKDIGLYFGGPNFIQIPSGLWIAAGRLITDKVAVTALCKLDVKNGTLQTLLKLPSGGDTSYPGLVWHDNILWVSYYSSHEGKTSIYLAKVSVQ